MAHCGGMTNLQSVFSGYMRLYLFIRSDSLKAEVYQEHMYVDFGVSPDLCTHTRQRQNRG